MKKEADLIVIAAKAVIDSQLRFISDEGDAKVCIREVFLHDCRKFLHSAILQVKDEKLGGTYVSIGCISQCEKLTSAILGECTSLCEHYELCQLPKCSQFIENVSFDFIPNMLEAELLAAESLEDFVNGKVDIDTAKIKILKFFDFFDWDGDDFDNDIPQRVLLAGLNIQRNNEVDKLFQEAISSLPEEKLKMMVKTNI